MRKFKLLKLLIGKSISQNDFMSEFHEATENHGASNNVLMRKFKLLKLLIGKSISQK
jgi:hypothetical protein